MSIAQLPTRGLRLAWRLFRARRTLPILVHPNHLPFTKFAHAGHFYSPIPDLNAIRARSAALFDRGVEAVPGIDLRVGEQLQLLERLGPLTEHPPFEATPRTEARYFFDNEYFSFGDGTTLLGMLRHYAPKRIIEVGSGFSSALMLDVNEHDFADQCQIRLIEPYPERLFSLLRDDDGSRCSILESPVQEVPIETFAELEAGDVLFIDSSHVAKAGSDVVYLLSEVLPALGDGVLVHFHDVFWPFEYPEHWILAGRAWNEAYMLKSFLQFNHAFEIVFFNSYLEYHHAEALHSAMPNALRPSRFENTMTNSSLWLRKVATQ